MKSTRLSSYYTISRKGSIVSSEGARVGLNQSKVSAAFLCVNGFYHFKRGKIYYAEFLENYFPHCPVKKERDAWYMYHENAAFPYVIKTEEIDKFFKRFA